MHDTVGLATLGQSDMAPRRSLCDLVTWERGLYSVGMRAEEVLGCGGLGENT